MSNWQPIDSVENPPPKTGKRSLFILPSGSQYTAYWNNDYEEWMTTIWTSIRGATHWQPLPEPPTS